MASLFRNRDGKKGRHKICPTLLPLCKKNFCIFFVSKVVAQVATMQTCQKCNFTIISTAKITVKFLKKMRFLCLSVFSEDIVLEHHIQVKCF